MTLRNGTLDGDLTTLAVCWRLVRADGIALGFTAHDRPLTIGGMLYKPRPGMTPSAVELREGVVTDTLEVGGVLSAGAITATDLGEGRWAAARVELIIVDWTAPDAGRMTLASGTLGDVSRRELGGGGRFTAELRSAAARLDVMIAPACSPECRAELGDDRCRVAMAGRERTVRIIAGTTAGALRVAPALDASFASGRVRVLSGAAAGLNATVLSVSGDTLELLERLRRVPEPGARLLAREGCDHRFETCATRFANAANFRGEPHVPGTDTLARSSDG